jgi:hypothetical protein
MANTTFWKFPVRIVLGLMGAVLLAGMFKRCEPWHMCYIPLHIGTESFVEFRHVPFMGILHIPYAAFIVLSFVLLPATLLLFRGARKAVTQLLGNMPALWGVSLSAACFLLSFFSGFFLQETRFPSPLFVRSAALYLTLGLYGTIFFFIGLYRYIIDFAIWHRLRTFVLTAKLPWFLAAVFLLEFLCANAVSLFAFDHLPHVQDSVAQVFHGKIFAAGRLTAPSPPLRDFFYYQHMINNGQWYSQYPPGHSFLMMLGLLLGAPWIINPLLGAATVVLLYALGRELYGDGIGRIAAVLGLFSPFVLFMSSEFMNHATTLFLFTVFLIFYARTVRMQSTASAIAAGAALGWIVNIRPLTAATLALPFALYACSLLQREFRHYKKPFLALSLAASVFVSLLLAFNYLTNGSPFLFGYQVLHGNEHLPGFGHAAWGEAHTLQKGIRNTLNNFVGLNKYLFEWPVPSLIFVCILVASGKPNRWDRMLFFAFLSLAAGYLLYWYQDWCFGPRFLYETAGIMILLTARGMQRVPYMLKMIFKIRISAKRLYGLTTSVAVFCTLYAMASNVPALYKAYSGNYWEVNRKLFRVVEQQKIGKAVIFTNHFFGCLLMANSPFLDTEVIYAVDLGQRNRKMMALYPGYRYFIARGDTIQEIFPE